MEEKDYRSKSKNNYFSTIDEVTYLSGNDSDENNNNSDKGDLNGLAVSVSTSGLNNNNNNVKGYLSNMKHFYNNTNNKPNNNNNDDTASAFWSMTPLTGYASIEYQLSDALVAMIGVGEYDGMDNLDGVVKDYTNIIRTFSLHWKYKLLFRLKNNQDVYSDDFNTLKLNENKDFKLKWNGDDIEEFIQVTRQHVVRNRHNVLIFVISSHGDSGRIMYDSDCIQYTLDSIYSMFQPNASALVINYSETQEESNYLSRIPKIFVLDMCRGSMTQTKEKNQEDGQEQAQEVTKTTQDKHVLQETQAATNHEEDEKKTAPELQLKEKNRKSNDEFKHDTTDGDETTAAAPKDKEDEKTVLELESNERDSKHDSELKHDSKDAAGETTAINEEEKEKKTANTIAKTKKANENEKLTFKSVSKDAASNFLKIYGTVERYGIADGSLHGGLFLTNFCKVFRDPKFVSNHDINAIVLKIRQYTKREATIASNLLQFTQVVETEGTLEKKFRFFNKKTYNKLRLLDQESNIHDTMTKKLLITNVSDDLSHRIYVLIENENSDDRSGMLNQLSKDKSLHLFEKYHFVLIEPRGGSYQFDKPFERVFITMFLIGNNDDNDDDDDDTFNVELYNRFATTEDYLYFENDSLNNLARLRLKCIKKKKHYLAQSKNYTGEKCVQCGNIAISNNYGDYSFFCRRCKYEICQNCCHKIVVSKYNTNLGR